MTKTSFGNPSKSKKQKTGEGSSSRDARATMRNIAQDQPGVTPQLTSDEIRALRSSILPINVKWAKSKSDRAQLSLPPSGANSLVFISKFAENLFEESGNKKIARMKQCDYVGVGTDFFSVYELFAAQGWTNAEYFIFYDDDIIRHFYANMWIDFDATFKPVAVNSLIKGRHVMWTLDDICRLTGYRSGGFDDISYNPWDSNRLGVSLKEVKTFLGVWPTFTTRDMPDELRITSLIVSYCICGKEAKLPSNLDYFITYKMKKGELVNYGAIFIRCLIEAVTLPNKAYTHGNLICKMLIASGIPACDLVMRPHSDTFDRDNIAQMIRNRRTAPHLPTKSAKGKGHGSSSQENLDDLFDDIGVAHLAAGIGTPLSDPEDNTGTGVEAEEAVAEDDDVRTQIQQINERMDDVRSDNMAEIDELKQENVKLKDKNKKLEKSVGKLKKFIKELLPTACFSSDED